MTRTSPSHAPARPQAALQRRGAERVAAILDAAERLLETEGYEAATLKAVGERAGIPTASMYHYFSDRRQVDAELIRRHIAGLDEAVAGVLATDEAVDSLENAVAAIIDPMLAYFRAHPSCVELWFAHRSEALDHLVRSFDDAIAEQLWRLALDRELLPEQTPLLVMQLAFEAGSRLFDVAFRRAPGRGDDVVIDEARRLLTAYLRTYTA